MRNNFNKFTRSSLALGLSAFILFSQGNVNASETQPINVTIEIPTELTIMNVDTKASTVAELLNELGVELSEKDTTSIALTAPLTAEDVVKIYRGFDLELSIDNVENVQQISIGTTVGDLVSEISTEDLRFYYNAEHSDVLSKNSAVELFSDVTLLEDGQINFHTDELLQFPVVEIPDETLPLGEEVVETYGQTGIKRTISVAEVLDGAIVSEMPVNIQLVSMPVEEVVYVGTGTNIDVEKWAEIVSERAAEYERLQALANSETTLLEANPEIISTDQTSITISSTDTIETSNTIISTSQNNNTFVFDEVTKDEGGNAVAILGHEVDVAITHDMNASAYSCDGFTGYTASGTIARVGVVAVDPEFIPLGTKMYIEGYGYAIAEDTGGSIKENKIDLYFNSEAECIQFGLREVVVHILA